MTKPGSDSMDHTAPSSRRGQALAGFMCVRGAPQKEIAMAKMDLWIHFDDEESSSMAFREPIGIDLDRFQGDDIYAHRLSTHINNALENLAKEIIELTIHAANNPPTEAEIAACE